MFGKLVAWLKVAEVGHDMGDFEAPDGFARDRPAWWSWDRARRELRHRSQARPEPEPAAKHSGWQPRARTKRQVDHQWDGSWGWQVDHQRDGMAGQARPKPAVVTAPAPARPPVTDLKIDETHGLAPRWGTERAPLGPPNSSSDDGLTAARMADLTNHREEWLADIAAATEVSYLEAAEMAAAKELEMKKIQKAQEEAEVLAKAEMDRLVQEAEERFNLHAQEEEAREQQEWEDAELQAQMDNAASTLEKAAQWEEEYQGYQSQVDDEGWWDGDRKSRADDEGAIRGILFS